MRFPKKVAVAFLMALALCAVGFCKSAHAQAAAPVDQPLLSWERISFAGGVNYAWHAAPVDGASPLPASPNEWEAGIYSAYNISPLLSLAASSVYGFDNKLVETRVGVRIRLGKGE